MWVVKTKCVENADYDYDHENADYDYDHENVNYD